MRKPRLPVLESGARSSHSAVTRTIGTPELYLGAVRPLEYRCLMETASDNLKVGTSAILSTLFIAELLHRDRVSRLTARCAARGIDVAVVWERFVLLRKLKAGTWRGSEYEFVSFECLTELRAAPKIPIYSCRISGIFLSRARALGRRRVS